MKRIDAISKITQELDDELVICNIGFPSRELYHVKDSKTHFYMLGSMGMASSIGLGLAMSVDRKVVVFDGDGSVLMNMGSLVTTYNQKPENLILDADSYIDDTEYLGEYIGEYREDTAGNLIKRFPNKKR